MHPERREAPDRSLPDDLHREVEDTVARQALVVALEALEVGDSSYAAAVILSALEEAA